MVEILGKLVLINIRNFKMPTIRQRIVASLTRRYPLYSGCGTFASHPVIQTLAGTSNERLWSSVPGGKVLASLDDYVGRAAFYVGDLDRKITWICSQIVRQGDTVLDIGANIGMVTIALSSLVGKTGKVHSFEPNPELQKVLEKTLEYNQITNVHIHPVALGAEQGSLELRIPKDNKGAASLIRNRDLTECEVIDVPILPLSKIVSQENIKSIRLIKIDVEGFEAEVLKGASQILKTIRPEAILFELNESFVGLPREQPVFKILSEMDYEFFVIPRCLFRMHLKYFDLNNSSLLEGHDFLAVPKGESYENIGKLVNAS
jgi:FkbM family methyltransferase